MLQEQNRHSISALYKAAAGAEKRGIKCALLDAIDLVVPSSVVICATFSSEDGRLCDATSRGLAVPDSELFDVISDVYRLSASEMVTMPAPKAERQVKASLLLQAFEPHRKQVSSVSEMVSDSSDGCFKDLVVLGRHNHSPFAASDEEALKELLFHVREADCLAITRSLITRARLQPKLASAIVTRSSLILGAHGRFTTLLQAHYPDWSERTLPFQLPRSIGAQEKVKGLFAKTTAVGERLVLEIWEKSDVDLLSPREKACVKQICSGSTFKEVASDMGVSLSTASTLLSRAMRKLGVLNRRSLKLLLSQHPGVI